MSLGGAYTDFTNFLKNIGRVYGDINLTGQIYRGVGSLFQQPPGDMSQFPLPSGLGKGLPFPPGAPSVTNSPNPLPQDPISQYEDTVGVVGRFYRPFDKPIVTPPPQNTSTVDPTFDFAEGGEVAPEYLYGVGPEGSGIGQFLSSLLPVRREVIEPFREEFIESTDPGQMERVVTPGQYGEPEFAVPEAVQAALNFKGLARDPEARQAVMKGLASLPGLPEEISRRLQISTQAAMSGEDEVYDPVSGGPVTASEALLMAPMLNAPGTAASIAMAGDKGGTVFGMMGGKKASGRYGEAAKKAEDLFNEGRRDTAVYRETGAIRATENKPAVPIEVFGQGGLDVSKLEELLGEPAIHASRLEDGFHFKDYVKFPNILEAYPELKNAEFRFLESTNDIWNTVRSPILVDPFYDPDSDQPHLFYVKSSINVHDNNIRPQIYGDVRSLMAVAIQDFISQKEGFVRPREINPAEAPRPSARNAEKNRREYLRAITREGQTPSPAQAFHAAKLGYPSDIDDITRSSLSQDRQQAMRPMYLDKPEQYRQKMMETYGARELDKYPLYFGQLMGDLGSPTKTTIEYESPLFGVVQKLPQEKGTGNQFLSSIKKAGVKQEDLDYMGLETFLTNRNSVTKSEIIDRLYERETPVYEEFLTDDKGNSAFFATSYVTGQGDGLPLANEAKPRDARSAALITRTDPITKTPATPDTISGYHRGLPDNTFAHMRFNERTVRVNGNPVDVLFIDEIQSDWHQKAAKNIRKRMIMEVPNEQGKSSGNIVGGPALENLVESMLGQQPPDVSREIFDQTLRNLDTTSTPNNVYNPETGAPTAKMLRSLRMNPKLNAEYLKVAKKRLNISNSDIKGQAKREVYGPTGRFPDAPFKDNWYELSFRRLVREAVEEGLDAIAFTPDHLQDLRYGRVDGPDEKKFTFYNKVLKPYVEKYAKRNETTLGTAKLRLEDGSDTSVWYMPLSNKIKETYKEPIPQYAAGGGVGSLAPIARNMFNGSDIKRGVGAYIPYTRR